MAHRAGAATGQPQPSLRSIALAGQPAPFGTDGEVFDAFFTPKINQAGQVGFHASLVQADGSGAESAALYVASAGSYRRVAVRGQATPGLAGGSFTFFNSLSLDKDGRMIFASRTDVPNQWTGVWTDAGGSVKLLVVVGDALPDRSDGAVYSDIRFQGANANGDFAFWDSSSQANSGLFVSLGGVLSTVGYANPFEPGSPPVPAFSSILGDLNDRGDYAASLYEPLIQIPGTGIVIGRPGIYVGSSAGLSEVVPGRSPLASSPGIGYRSFARPTLNEAGNLAFQAAIRDDSTGQNTSGIWSDASGALSQVVQDGQAAPDLPNGFVLNQISRPAMNRHGDIVFRALGVSDGSITARPNQGLWHYDGDEIELIVWEPQPAPGSPAFYSFESFDDDMQINDNGYVVFRAEVHGSSVRDTRFGVWAWKPGGVVFPVAVPSQMIDVNTDPAVEDLREIEGVQPLSEFGSLSTVFNERNEVVLNIDFTDGSSGIFVATVPQPGSLAVLALGAVLLIHRRRGFASGSG